MKKTVFIIVTLLLVSLVGVLVYFKIFNKNTDNNVTGKTKDSLVISIISFSKISDETMFISGKIERGIVKTGDDVSLIGMGDEVIDTKISSLSSFSGTIKSVEDLENAEKVDEAKEGDMVFLTIDNVSENQVKIGQVLATPNTIKAHDKMDANIYVYTKEEGGRNTSFFNGYSPLFRFWNEAIEGKILVDKEIKPGETGKATVEIKEKIAMDEGMEFDIVEGGRKVGKATVTKVY